MLDTNICSHIMRNKPASVLPILKTKVENKDSLVISAITYSELRYGAIGKKSSLRHNTMINDFLDCIDSVVAWDKGSVEESVKIKKALSDIGKPISNNDIAIAGNAIANNCILVTNNTKEFKRVKNLKYENWIIDQV